MLLQSDNESAIGQKITECKNSLQTVTPGYDCSRELDIIQDTLKDGWTVHCGKEGRLYYCNHITKTAGWLPPIENWNSNENFPYGWEKAVNPKGRSYYINHLNKTTTYEAPEFIRWDDTPPEPREVSLQRSTTMGFGFVAGSERPVIVRFVTEGGPSVNKLQPGDQILAVNGEDVKNAPRDHVIQLVRSCEYKVTLLVCQPFNNIGPGRKSTILSAGKKAKLRTRPNRVRFAESVCVNGAPLFPPSAFSLGDLCVPPMANVLKVFLENGQTKSFKYDATTTVQNVVTSLHDKLCLNAKEHFSLVLEHVKSLKRNKLTLLDPEETLARIAARPGAHKLRCLFRVTFVPVSAADIAQRDLNSLDYLYMQCCNDVTQERFAPELQPDVALRLAALHMHQHALANNVPPAKLTVKTVEQEFGLERFVPSSLLEGMKRKELRRLIAHFLKLNSQMTGSSSKMLTQLQAKIHYLDIISGLPSYGAKCFSTNQRDGMERVLLVSPRFGLSQITGTRNSIPQPITTVEDISRVSLIREDDITYSVLVFAALDRIIKFLMDERDAIEFIIVLTGYHKLLTGKDLLIDRDREQSEEDNPPTFLAQHSVLPAAWSYLPQFQKKVHSINFLVTPSYQILESFTKKQETLNHCDRNMNTNMPNHNHKSVMENGQNDEYGFDIHSVMAMELLEGAKESRLNGIVEAKNDEVLRRVAEMQRMVESSEQYLNEHGELIHEYEMKCTLRQPWSGVSADLDSDCESLNSSKVSSNDDVPPAGALKHSDSLVLLAEAISQDLSGITQGLNSINTNINDSNLNNTSPNIQTKPKSQIKVNGLSQLLTELQAIGNDYSQSESDTESIHTPSISPTNCRPIGLGNIKNAKNKAMRTSFGLHSPDSSILGSDAKEHNLKEYLKQLKEISKIEDQKSSTDSAAEKLTQLHGFEINGDTFIETDPDVIDLRALAPPQTPQTPQLDVFSVLNDAPLGFDDNNKSEDEPDLEKFLAKVVVAPPTQKTTPSKELTSEEIMSYIIPPPPNMGEKNKLNSTDLVSKNIDSVCYSNTNSKENLYNNLKNHSNITKIKTQDTKENGKHIIEYATVDRKGPFSCCSKSSKEINEINCNTELKLPPRKCIHSDLHHPPDRPPKHFEVQLVNQNPSHGLVNLTNGTQSETKNNMKPPALPPRTSDYNQIPPLMKTTIPKKPPLPPMPARPILKNSNTYRYDTLISSPSKVAGISSPHLHRNLSIYKEIDNAFTSPKPAPRLNGHYRSNSDSPSACLKSNYSLDTNSPLSLMCSPQFSRKYQINSSNNHFNDNNSTVIRRNGNINNGEALLAKTDIAMAGLLVKLDQVAAQCTSAQLAGGGTQIDEEKFQRAREELTEQSLKLVTASKMLVVAISDITLSSLPEHLTSCLTAIRRITELTQDMAKHTSSPLQTRNIVLKVHDVTSSFRELAGVQIGPLGAGQLALHAECLANVLATLLRSLRVFSP